MNVAEKPLSDVEVSSQSLTPLQATVQEKLAQTVKTISMDILTRIMLSKQMDGTTFVAKFITLDQSTISSVESVKKTKKFFEKMIEAVNEQLNTMAGLEYSFKRLENLTQDNLIREKLIKACSIHPVLTLVNDLNNLKSTIIDDIISG